MHHTQRGRQVLIIRRLTRHWSWAALGLLLLLATTAYGQKPPEIYIDYHGDVWRRYFTPGGGTAREEKLGNIHQPGGYHGPVPPGYYSAGSWVRGEHTTPPQPLRVTPPPRTNPPRQPVLPRRVSTPRLESTIKIVTFWGRQVRRTRNGRVYLDWDRHPNGTIKTVQMVGYRYDYSNGTSRFTGVQAADDANMRRQGYLLVTANTTRLR